MSSILSELDLLDLGGAEHSDDGAVLSDSLDVTVHVLVGVGLLVVSLGVVGESSLLGGVVVLVDRKSVV